METYENIYNNNILPKYGSLRNKDHDNNLLKENSYPHQYSILDRVNLEDLNTISIDPPNCKDADDAFSIYFKNGKLFLAIHIADPTEFISPNSILWEDITKRVITHYPSNNQPIHLMPDEILKLCSLNTDNDPEIKNAISIITEIDKNSNLPINNVKLEFTRVKVSKQYAFSYEEASNLSDEMMEVYLGLKISKALREKRSLKTIGTKLSELNYSYPIFENNNIKINTDSEKTTLLKQMIGEFAIFANSFVGEYLKINLNGIGIFRTYDATNLEYHNNMSGQELLNQIIDHGISAEYLSEINSHDLVGAPEYCHFTSPIRRVTDCICHYLIRTIKLSLDVPWNKEELEYFSNKFHIVSKKEKNIQYNDKKFRIIQLLNQILHEDNSNFVYLEFRITSYTGMFLNLIINKIFVNNKEYNIQISYSLRISNKTLKENLSESYKIMITTVNPFYKFDEGTLPDIDCYLKENVFIN